MWLLSTRQLSDAELLLVEPMRGGEVSILVLIVPGVALGYIVWLLWNLSGGPRG